MQITELIKYLKIINNISIVTFVSNNSGDTTIFQSNESIFLINVENISRITDSNFKSNDDKAANMQKIFVDISYGLKEPALILDENKIQIYHEQLDTIINNIMEDITNKNICNIDTCRLQVKNNSSNMMIDIVAMHGMLLEYPIIYCTSTSKNCLSNILLTSFSIYPTVEGNMLQMWQPCYAFTCPTKILEIYENNNNNVNKDEPKSMIIPRIKNHLLVNMFPDRRTFSLEIKSFSSTNSVGV